MRDESTTVAHRQHTIAPRCVRLVKFVLTGRGGYNYRSWNIDIKVPCGKSGATA